MNVCLVVDDSDVICKYTRLIFESLGYRVLEAANPVDAIDRLAGQSPAIIFVDWIIPEHDPLAFISKIRTLQLPRRPYIFYMATENDYTSFEEAKKAGADDCILKPFNREIIEIAIKDIKFLAA